MKRIRRSEHVSGLIGCAKQLLKSSGSDLCCWKTWLRFVDEV